MKNPKLSVACFLVAAIASAHAAPAPKKLPAATQTQIAALLRDPIFSSGRVGIAIRALGTAKNSAQTSATPYNGGATPLLLNVDGEKRFLPASNQKLWTAAWVLAQLGAQKKFATVVRASQAQFFPPESWPATLPLPLGLVVEGDGDPSLTSADLDELAAKIAARDEIKIKKLPVLVRVAPSQLGAEENGRRYPDGWTLDDATWYYGAPVTGWALNRNQVDVTLTGAKVGAAATLKIDPPAPFDIFSAVSSVAPNDARLGAGLHFERGDLASPLGNSLVVRGVLESGKTDTEGVAIPDPRAWVENDFKAKLRARGVVVLEPEQTWSASAGNVIATHNSASLSQIVRRFLKNSDNLYGEMLLRRAAIEAPPSSKKWPQIASTGLAARAHSAMLDWATKNRVTVQNSRFSDGSGLSRYNLQTPDAMTQIMALAQKSPTASAFYDALPIAGVDGTLKNRMKNSAAVGNVRAKTGTFSIANCLSGYVTTRDGNRLAVSILTNFVPDGEAAREWQGKVFAVLAGAKW